MPQKFIRIMFDSYRCRVANTTRLLILSKSVRVFSSLWVFFTEQLVFFKSNPDGVNKKRESLDRDYHKDILFFVFGKSRFGYNLQAFFLFPPVSHVSHKNHTLSNQKKKLAKRTRKMGNEGKMRGVVTKPRDPKTKRKWGTKQP